MNEEQTQLNNEFKGAIVKLERHAKTSNDEVRGIQIDIGDIKVKQGEIKTDVSWLKKFFLIVATSSVGALIAGVINLLIK